MTPKDEAALAIYQSNRDAPREKMRALLDQFFTGAEYAATIDAVRNAMNEREVQHDAI